MNIYIYIYYVLLSKFASEEYNKIILIINAMQTLTHTTIKAMNFIENLSFSVDDVM